MRFPFLALICAVFCFTNASAQQTQAPPGQPAVTFKTEVNYVDVDAIVTDQQRTFVKNLTPDRRSLPWPDARASLTQRLPILDEHDHWNSRRRLGGRDWRPAV